MNKKALVFAVAAACLTSGAAFAQSYDYRSDRNDGDQRRMQYERNDHGDRYDRSARYDRSDRRDYRRHDGYNHSDRSDRYDRYNRYESRSNGYGYGDNYQRRYQMQRGERLSQYYRGDQYVVNDWRSHRLYAPQRGYQWVQAGNDYALVAIATGIIATVLLNH